MTGIVVPPRAAAALARHRLVSAILQHIAFEPDPAAGEAATTDRKAPLTIWQLRDAFERLGVGTNERDRVMAQLLRERIVRTDGSRVWVGDLADLRTYLAKQQGEASVLVGIA